MHVAGGRCVGSSGICIRRDRLLWLLVALLAATAVTVAARAVSTTATHTASMALPWPILAGLFYLAEVRVLQLRFRRETHSYSLSEVPLVVGLFLASPADVLLAATLGCGLGLLVHRRPPLVKLAFNGALFLLVAAVGVVIFESLGGKPDPFDAHAVLATYAATTASMVAGLIAVNAAIAVAQGGVDTTRVAFAVRLGLLVAAANTTLALITVALLHLAPDQVWVLAFPLALGLLAWRGYGAAIARSQAAMTGSPIQP